jgi:hypothetical protein
VTNQPVAWEPLLDFPLAQTHSLASALLTTYDPPDIGFLVEHFLPPLLDLDRQPSPDSVEQRYFLGELETRLRLLQGRLTIVSSSRTEATLAPRYRWLSRYVKCLSVGARASVTQHAKVWLLEWHAKPVNSGESKAKPKPDLLELVVSSCNLTSSGFKDQLQAAWRLSIPLVKGKQKPNWGPLVPFLSALDAATRGPVHSDAFTHAKKLLRRARCPDGIRFIASVPGQFNNQQLASRPWGAAALSDCRLTGHGTNKIRVLSPFIGTWPPGALGKWAKAAGASVKELDLIWIDQLHPWTSGWRAPVNSVNALQHAAVGLLRLCHEKCGDKDAAGLHPEHLARDNRWSHAKLYQFRKGRQRKVLLSSANFSPSAWGFPRGAVGGLSIENFEFGVLLDQAAWPEELERASLESFGSGHQPWVSEEESIERDSQAWAQAVWNGRSVEAQCRLPEAAQGFPKGVLLAAKTAKSSCKVAWREIGKRIFCASIPWIAPTPPATLQISWEQASLSIPIVDTREVEVDEKLESIGDAADAQDLADRLLLERYGGPAAELDQEGKEDELASRAPDGDEKRVDTKLDESCSATRKDSYAVPSFAQARDWFDRLDCWWSRIVLAKQRRHRESLDALRADGRVLVRVFERAMARESSAGHQGHVVAAELVREELQWRLEELGG